MLRQQREHIIIIFKNIARKTISHSTRFAQTKTLGVVTIADHYAAAAAAKYSHSALAAK